MTVFSYKVGMILYQRLAYVVVRALRSIQDLYALNYCCMVSGYLGVARVSGNKFKHTMLMLDIQLPGSVSHCMTSYTGKYS